MKRLFFVIAVSVLQQMIVFSQQSEEILSIKKLTAREIQEMCIGGEVPSYKLEEQLYDSRYAVSANGIILYNAQISNMLRDNPEASILFTKSLARIKTLNRIKSISVPYLVVAGLFGLSMSIAGVENNTLDIAYVAVYSPVIIGAIYSITLRPSALRLATEAVSLYNGQQVTGNKPYLSTLSFGITAGGLGLKINF